MATIDHTPLFPAGLMVAILYCSSNHQARLAVLLFNATTNTNYRRLVFNGGARWQNHRVQYAAFVLFCPLDWTELFNFGANYSCLHSPAAALVKDSFTNYIGALNSNHGCLLCWWQAQFDHLQRSNSGDVGTFLSATAAGTMDKKE